MLISDRIRLVLQKRKIKDETIAQWLGITPQRISQKFKASNWDSLKELMIVAEKAECSFYWLCTGEGSETEYTKVAHEPIVEYKTSTKTMDVNYMKELIDSQKETISLLKGEIERLKREKKKKHK